MNGFLSNLSIRSKLLLAYLLHLPGVHQPRELHHLHGRPAYDSGERRERIDEHHQSYLEHGQERPTPRSRTTFDQSLENRDIVQYYYDEYQQGKMSEATAKEKATEVLLSQIIGKTGYIYCVDSKGVLRVHPKISGTDLSKEEFIHQQTRSKEGYLDTIGQTPARHRAAEGALYDLLWPMGLDHLRLLLPRGIQGSPERERLSGQYPHGVLGQDRIPLCHGQQREAHHPPQAPGPKRLRVEGLQAVREFIKEIIEKKNGEIIYPWQNPGEAMPRGRVRHFQLYSRVRLDRGVFELRG